MKKRNGQAMVEFLVGLVGIMFLILGLNLIARIVDADFDTIIGARMDVAEALTGAASLPNTQPNSQVYAGDTEFFKEFGDNIIYESGNTVSYSDTIGEYDRGERVDGFGFLGGGPDPLEENTASSARSANVSGLSTLLQKLIGSSQIGFENTVAMPIWDDLME